MMMPAEIALESFSRVGVPGAGVATAPDEPGNESGTVDAERGKVLVVDDEPAVVELIGEYLNIQGFAVVSAGSGLEALARLEADRPDAVLLDVRMPGMDGIETLKRIVAKKTGARVLMCSANDDLMLAKEAIALGAFDYILKPIDFGYLSRALDQMTRREAPIIEEGLTPGPMAAGAGPASQYDLAIEVCRVTRALPRSARRSVGTKVERIALSLVRQGPGAERRRLLRTLNELRTLLRFAKDMGDISDDVHRQLESHMVRVRRGLGMS